MIAATATRTVIYVTQEEVGVVGVVQGVTVVEIPGATEVVTRDETPGATKVVTRDEIPGAMEVVYPAVPAQNLAIEVIVARNATVDAPMITEKIVMEAEIETTGEAAEAEAATRKIGRREESVFTRTSQLTCRSMILERPNSTA